MFSEIVAAAINQRWLKMLRALLSPSVVREVKQALSATEVSSFSCFSVPNPHGTKYLII